MKKFSALILSFVMLALVVPVGAANSYITIHPYPYSTHVLGEDLVIYGDTDFGNVTLGLFYPRDQGYNGMSKFVMTISANELRQGYVIHTGAYSRLWPTGDWRIKVQNGNVSDEIYITMSEEPVYDQVLKVVEYEDSALTSITSYATRGVLFKDNVLSFTLEDETAVKIYSWNNLKPTDQGEGKIYIASYNDGYLTSLKSYEGTLSSFGYHISLKIDENKAVKLLYWDENLTPVT